jgi:hypothetical protein
MSNFAGVNRLRAPDRLMEHLTSRKVPVSHVIEPLAYGHSTGLSPVVVVGSATFWTNGSGDRSASCWRRR